MKRQVKFYLVVYNEGDGNYRYLQGLPMTIAGVYETRESAERAVSHRIGTIIIELTGDME